MAEQQHTPGPWRYIENRNTPRVESEATAQWVCNFFGEGGLYASHRANARLIAAAPAMLAALEHHWNAEMRREAIAQARGREAGA